MWWPPVHLLTLFFMCDHYVVQVIIAQKVVQGVYPGVTTTELDELAAETGELHQPCCAAMADSTTTPGQKSVADT